MKKIIFIFISVTLLSFSPNNTVKDTESAPDVTDEFNDILKDTKSTFKGLKKKWKVDAEMIISDIEKYNKQDNLNKAVSLYYQDFDSYRNVETQIQFLIGFFKTNGKGDLKNKELKKYNNNGGKVIYNGKQYTVEQLGNINYGVALKAFGYPMVASTCAGGAYQLYADQCLNRTTYSKYKSAIEKCFKSKKGMCFDYKGDTQMIKEGYKNF
jgi:hypothetical protein